MHILGFLLINITDLSGVFLSTILWRIKVMVFNATFNNYIVVVSFIGGIRTHSVSGDSGKPNYYAIMTKTVPNFIRSPYRFYI